MIKINNLSKAYGEKCVLNNFTHAFRKGDFVAILGQSGVGKTTLLSIIAGILEQDSGDIELLNDSEIRMVFQEDRLLEWLTVYKNINIICEDTEYIDDILKRLGVFSEKDKLPNQLSGGQRQRVAIARALCAKPNILLLDEPFSALDTENAINAVKIIKEIMQDGVTILVTHNTAISNTVCNDTIILK